MPTQENLKELFKIKEKLVKLRVHVPTGVDLDKLKSMTLTPLIAAFSTPPGGKSNFQIISIAGETMSLGGTTGLLSDEKAFGDKSEFERLYVHPDLKADQANLEELVKRMFQITSSFLRKPILPPKDPNEYSVLMKSLKYRLELLQREISEMDETNSIHTRQTLEHFYRLRDLITQLEGAWKKKRVQTYTVVASNSGKPPTQEDKLSIDEEEAARLLQQFGLVLLQAQHQLPGFSFPFSTNELVAKLRSLDINATDLEDAVGSEGHEIQPAIEDVLHPDEKKAAAEKEFVKMAQTLLQAMVDNLPDEDTADMFAGLLDPDSPPATVSGFLKDLFDITEDISETRSLLLDRIKPLRQQMERLQSELVTAEAKVSDSQTKLAALEEDRNKEYDETSQEREILLEEIDELKEELEDLEDEKNACINDTKALQSEIVRLQTEELQKQTLETTVTKLRKEVEGYKQQVQEKASLVKQLEEKDTQMRALQLKQRSLEDLETVTRSQRQEIANLQKLQKQLSKERMDLETRLGSYKGLEKLVSEIPLNTSVPQKTEFDAFASRIRKLLDERREPDTNVSSVTESDDENNESKSNNISGDDMKGGSMMTPVDVEVDIPTVLEMKAAMVNQMCSLLSALETVYSQMVEGMDQELLDEMKKIATLDEPPALVAEALQTALVFSVTDQDNSVLVPYQSIYETLSTVISSENEFDDALRAKGVDNSRLNDANEKLEAAGLSPWYAFYFYLYLEALVSWINSLENISKPLECPQIPPILKRDLQ